MRLKNCIQVLTLSAASLYASENASLALDSSAISAAPIVSANTSCPPCPCDAPLPLCPLNHRFQIGGNYTYAWITPEENPTTKGNLGGLQAIYEYRPLRSIYCAAAFAWRDGSTSNDVTTRTLQDFNVQERIGYTFTGKKMAHVRYTLFTGFGARHLAETVTVGVASVDFDYTEFYVPLGFLFEHQINSRFSWGCNFQWMPQIFPLVRIEPLSGAQWDLSYRINNFFVEVPFRFAFDADRWSLIIAPFFETWHDGPTTAVTSFGLALDLPGNSYIFTGVNVNFGYSF